MYVSLIHSTNCFLWTDPQSETCIGVPEFGRIYSARDLVSEAVILFLGFSAQWIAVFVIWITIRDCFAGYMGKTIAETGRHGGRARLWFTLDVITDHYCFVHLLYK